MTRPARTFLTAAAALALTLGLASCGDGAGTADSPSASSAQDSTETTAATSAGTEGSPSATDDGDGEARDDATREDRDVSDDSAIAAADAAEALVPGTRAFDVEVDDDGGYNVDVSDGATVTEVKVVNGSATVAETDDLDDERAELAAAAVSLQDAVATALAANPGTVTDVELDDDDNSTVVRWEIEIDLESGGEIEVYVDAATGEQIG